MCNGLRNRGNGSDESHDCLEIDPTQFDPCSSDESSGEKQVDKTVKPSTLHSSVLKNYLIDATNSNDDSTYASMTHKNPEEEDWKDRLYSGIALDGKNQKSLEGIRILLAEDTLVLQRLATIMLEKMGATVTAVGDGQQVVDALNSGSIYAQDPTQEHKLSEEDTTKNIINPQSSFQNSSPYDLILMDCQVKDIPILITRASVHSIPNWTCKDMTFI